MKDLQKAIERIKRGYDFIGVYGEEVADWLVKELTQLITSREQEIREEAVQEFMEYCWDGGEHDGWIISKADSYFETLSQQPKEEA